MFGLRIHIPDFPNSFHEPFTVTSPQTSSYNCIAWAFGDNSRWYWPDDFGLAFWPSNLPRIANIENFIALFETIGYEICENGEFEIKFEKIVVFQDDHGVPTHAARQLTNGMWSSKLGEEFDVSHSIFSIEGGPYGHAAVFMSRSK